MNSHKCHFSRSALLLFGAPLWLLLMTLASKNVYRQSVMIGLIIYQFIFHWDLCVAPEGMCQNLNEIYGTSVKAIISNTSCCRVSVQQWFRRNFKRNEFKSTFLKLYTLVEWRTSLNILMSLIAFWQVIIFNIIFLRRHEVYPKNNLKHLLSVFGTYEVSTLRKQFRDNSSIFLWHENMSRHC